jgi:hypothetical protein
MSNDKQKSFTFQIDIWICITQFLPLCRNCFFFQLSREVFTRHSKTDIAWHVDIISQVMQDRFHQLFRCTFYQSCRKVLTDHAKTVFACHINTVFPEVMQGSFHQLSREVFPGHPVFACHSTMHRHCSTYQYETVFPCRT